MVRRIGLVLALALLSVACGSPALPDAERIEARLEAMAAALAERDAGAVLAPLADDFSAQTRDLDRRAMRLLLRREMNAHERLRARIYDFSATIHSSDRASAEFHAVLTGGSGLIPRTGRWYRVETGWRHEGGDWVLISASWDGIVGRP